MNAGSIFDYRDHMIFIDAEAALGTMRVGVYRIADEAGTEVHRGHTTLNYENSEAARIAAGAAARDFVDQILGYVTNEKEVDGLHVSFLLWRRGDVWACRVLRPALEILTGERNVALIAAFYENRELIIKAAVRQTIDEPYSNAVILKESDFISQDSGRASDGSNSHANGQKFPQR